MKKAREQNSRAFPFDLVERRRTMATAAVSTKRIGIRHRRGTDCRCCRFTGQSRRSRRRCWL